MEEKPQNNVFIKINFICRRLKNAKKNLLKIMQISQINFGKNKIRNEKNIFIVSRTGMSFINEVNCKVFSIV
jgi:hypothetical protein